jgi:hypothetical protein
MAETDAANSGHDGLDIGPSIAEVKSLTIAGRRRELELRPRRTHIRRMKSKLQHSQHRAGRLHAGR